MSWFRFYSSDREDHDHIAASIVFTWQQDYSKGWKWNNAHRHMSEEPRVPLWDDGSCMSSYTQHPIPYIIPVSFTPVERVAIYRIRLIRNEIRKRERERQQNKRRWWLHNVERRDLYRKEYDYYRYHSMVPQMWLGLAMKHGVTFRHLRNFGYRKYIDIAGDLEDDLERIDIIVRAQIHPWIPQNISRPFIVLE